MIKQLLTAIGHKISQMFDDDDGRGSFTRGGVFISLVCALEWVSHIVHKTNKLPEPTELAALAGFVCVLMTINRSDNIIAAIRGTHVPIQSPPKGEGQS